MSHCPRFIQLLGFSNKIIKMTTTFKIKRQRLPATYLDVASGVRSRNARAEGGRIDDVEWLAMAHPQSGGRIVSALRVGILPAAVGVALAEVHPLLTVKNYSKSSHFMDVASTEVHKVEKQHYGAKPGKCASWLPLAMQVS